MNDAVLNLRGQKVAVFGMGKSGLAATELLLKHGASVSAVDEKDIRQLGSVGERLQELGVPLLAQTAAAAAGADLIVVSPGIPPDIEPLAAAPGARIVGELELAGYFLKGPVIGVTGANGKTTTTALIGHILGEAKIARQVGGNIGTAPTAMIETSRDDQWNVLELSSFQLETIHQFQAKIGVATNVTPDHLDRHGTFERYAAAKARLFETQGSDAYAVLNADDAVCVSFASRTKAQPVWFSRLHPVSPGAFASDGSVFFGADRLLPIADIPLRGAHNLENTLAAAAVCRLAGASGEAIAAGIRSFPGVEHRLEFVREVSGVQYYNDSKATNVDATEKAIDAFSGGLWIILGGKDKNSDYSVLRDKLAAKARQILLIGAAANKIEQHLSGLPLTHAGTLDGAVRIAAQAATSGETVLLAPACASFDQFQSYEHRGRVFKDLVRAL